ncbi:unnamed protein product, partial [Rotaria sp. Silwood1]
MFFEQFQSIFSNGIKSQWYEMKDIIELFTWIRLQDQLFSQYFSHYSSNVNTDDLWDMFLKLGKLNIINSVNQKHVISILTEKIPLTSVGPFHRYTKSAKTCLVEIKPEFCSQFIELFKKIFDGYIIKQFNYPQYSYQVSRTDCNDLLQIEPFKDLRRLCHLFNCLISFQILNSGTLNTQDNTIKYLT